MNKELQRTGGRTLVRIGSEDVDYSPKFKIILSTKNPAVQLTPDICSRVTLVNFTVTPDSLESQSLSQLVSTMKPDLETQRAALLKLQGEQNVKLRELEDQMLSKISACEGSILDDNNVVEGMEKLMKEGSQVEEQISKSDEVMAQVHQAVARFEPFSRICRKLFVLLEALRELSFLYEFPANIFMTVLHETLRKYGAGDEADEANRIILLKKELFREVAARIGRGLQVDDKIVFSILLARLYTGDKTIGSTVTETSAELVKLVTDTFGHNFPWEGRALNDLADVTESDIGPTVPLLLCSAQGHDVSGRVESMARDLHKELNAVAMGSSEGFETADALLASGTKRGGWVMLKNVHLCIDWLKEVLVKRVQALGGSTHKDFRLFITSEISPRLPTGLLRISDKIVAEAPSGVKASLYRFFSSISKDRFDNPVRNRLYLLLGWLHAVIQERLRFVPQGWTQKYEFTEADATHALDVIDSLLGDGKGRLTLDPEKLPWDAIRATLCRGVFGGRITSDTDQKVLNEIVDYLFSQASFNVDFKLVPSSEDGPKMPEGNTREAYREWIEALPEYTPPEWIGLNRSAEKEREKRLVESTIEKVSLIQEHSESDN